MSVIVLSKEYARDVRGGDPELKKKWKECRWHQLQLHRSNSSSAASNAVIRAELEMYPSKTNESGGQVEIVL